MAKDVQPKPDAIELAILGEGDGKLPVMDDPEAVAREIAYRILDAADADELFEQATATSARDVLNVPLRIKSVRWQESRYEGEGPKVYALIDAERGDNGDSELITCGSRNVMAQLYRAGQLGMLPMDNFVKLVENETARGTGAMWLARA